LDEEEISLPSNTTLPEVIGALPKIARPVVLFPDPDSPTNPSVSPGAISKLTFSTA
jgi:hypothetical protein